VVIRLGRGRATAGERGNRKLALFLAACRGLFLGCWTLHSYPVCLNRSRVESNGLLLSNLLAQSSPSVPQARSLAVRITFSSFRADLCDVQSYAVGYCTVDYICFDH
jgi:hypothetical protein